jgi:hypothetical protein
MRSTNLVFWGAWVADGVPSAHTGSNLASFAQFLSFIRWEHLPLHQTENSLHLIAIPISWMNKEERLHPPAKLED